MAQLRAWRTFKRMQGSTCAFASLVFTAAVVHAWRVLPGSDQLKLIVTLGFPALYCLLSLLIPLQVPLLRRLLKRYVWMSFAAGFGQTVSSVLTGLGVVAAAAVFIYAQISGATHGGRYPSGAFSAYGAGLGILFAQGLLVFALEREPEVREIIEG